MPGGDLGGRRDEFESTLAGDCSFRSDLFLPPCDDGKRPERRSGRLLAALPAERTTMERKFGSHWWTSPGGPRVPGWKR